jgi:hypothetical protein
MILNMIPGGDEHAGELLGENAQDLPLSSAHRARSTIGVRSEPIVNRVAVMVRAPDRNIGRATSTPMSSNGRVLPPSFAWTCPSAEARHRRAMA